MKVEEIAIDSVRPYPGNPRRGNLDLLRESLRINRQYKPIVISTDSVILAGNHTWQAAKDEGWTTITAVRADFDHDTDDARRILLVDNRSGDLGAYSDEDLLVLLKDLSGELEGTGYGPDDLNALVRALNGDTPSKTDPDVVPEPPKRVITKPGDLWQLGPHRLLCGDSSVPADIAKLLTDAAPAMVLTDPPFAIYGSSTGIGRDIADDKMVRPFFEAMWRTIHNLLPEFAHAYVHCDWRSWAALWDGAARGGMVVKNMLVWDKGSGGLGSNFQNSHELLCFAAKLPPAKAMKMSERTGQRTVYKANILRFPRVTGNDRQHNAAKPVALLAELIEASSDLGAGVVDLYAGSGSTLIAVEKTERRGLLMEIEPKWCDVIVARWEQFTGGKAVRHTGGQEQPHGKPTRRGHRVQGVPAQRRPPSPTTGRH